MQVMLCSPVAPRLGLSISESSPPGTKVQRRSHSSKSCSLSNQKHLMVIEVEINLMEAVRKDWVALPSGPAAVAGLFRN